MSIINGYKEPVFKLTDPQGREVITIALPLTGEKGLVESYDIKKIKHELLDYTTLQKIDGYIIHFTLHYDSFIEGETLLKIKQIIEFAAIGYKIELIPRKDYLWRKFEVFISSDNFSLGLLGGYNNAKGHRLPVLVFTTKYLQQELQWSAIGDTYFGTGLFSPIEGEQI